ncbi:hypothetical protein HSISS4_00745 [Streptococcus salivarius]|uniref:hypothetical protein n=2 Tax=Streptococcus TaxID=1301 RepID=UPI00071F5C25|nr:MULTISPECIES: hypothetical protein [Streptococcus]ALR79757.1 hypothetical protein HSISS4_00745 [Streptococcus salivarius]MCP9061795.1 hypothetical protein [Streptococcus salivarius]MCP9063708.1 hypothetical protein [Streptococcus salivarius]MDU5225672.1 hypothetical protein [Streptococcus sp.]MDU7739653.1 hypothetical protein [Streptococcus sp.]
MKKKIVILLLVAIAITAGLFYFLRSKSGATSEEHIRSYPEPEFSLQLSGDNKEYVLVNYKKSSESSGVIGVTKDYLVSDSSDTNDVNNIQNYTSYNIYLYDLNSKDFKKSKIDLLSIVKQYKLKGQLSEIATVVMEGKDYLFFKVDYTPYLFDLKQKKITTAPETILDRNSLKKDSSVDFAFIVDLDNILFKKYGVLENEKYHSFILGVNSEEKKPELSQLNIKKEYPEIVKTLENEGNIYTRYDSVDSEQWFNTLIHWFAPKGQDVMDLYVTDKTTGEKTQIKSFADYQTWKASQPTE